MFKRRKILARCPIHLDSNAIEGFTLGAIMMLALVLILDLWLPASAVEEHVLEAAAQALHGNRSP